MREIKFRAWDKEHQVMIKWDEYLKDEFTGDYFEYDDLVIMQYIGLKDKHGEEIYEGDIIEYLDYSGGAIIFGGKQPKSKGVIKINAIGRGIEYLRGIGKLNEDKVEILGNIYENPEILEVEE